MSSLQQLLSDYQELCDTSIEGPWEKKHAPELSLTGLHVEAAMPVATPQDVDDRIASFAPTKGWYCRQSSIEVIDDTPWGPEGPHDSPILDGELVNGKGESLHIRHTGDCWVLTHFVEAPGVEFLVEETRFENEYADPRISERQEVPDKEPPNRELLYKRYWTIEGDEAVIAHARFIGFRS